MDDANVNDTSNPKNLSGGKLRCKLTQKRHTDDGIFSRSSLSFFVVVPLTVAVVVDEFVVLDPIFCMCT